MIGAYRLRYNGRSWADMWAEQPCRRPMGCGNYRALQWYAFWLNENYGLKISDIGEDSGCYDGNSSKVLKLCSPWVMRRPRLRARRRRRLPAHRKRSAHQGFFEAR